MNSKALFLEVIKREFGPYLRTQGFKGSGQNFYRIREDLVHVINLRASKYGDGFAVNLGIHPTGMQIEGSSVIPEPKRLKEYECLIRTRLSKSEEYDRWWKHRGFLRSPEKSARALISFYENYGNCYFDTFPDARALLASFSFEDPNKERLVRIAKQEMRIGRACIVGAWLAEHLGDYLRATELACFAQENRWEKWPFDSEVCRLKNLAAQQGTPCKNDSREGDS